MLPGSRAPRWLHFVLSVLFFLLLPVFAQAQSVDNFDGPKVEGWFTMTGDGSPSINLVQQDGFLRLVVDGSTDKHGVWWTLIKRDITPSLDLAKLADPAYELRVEARVRSSVAPRRVNFMLNTNRTTNYHQHLREYDLADTDWHTISMTTRDFDARPGDTVYVQFCVTDYGPDKYNVDVDYYRADVVRRDQVGPDVGEPLIVHPVVPDTASFAHHLGVAHDSLINREFPEVNFNDWHVQNNADAQGDSKAKDAVGPARVLTMTADQWIVLRWDPEKLRNLKATGPGILELTTYSAPTGGKYIQAMGQDFGEEFPRVHVIEILGGDPAWDQDSVTWNSLIRGAGYAEVFNSQITIDLELAEKPGAKTYFTLPRPVMQRLLEGKTKGILLRPLGAFPATVYASEDPGGRGPKLHF
jgi:hypothetical protein